MIKREKFPIIAENFQNKVLKRNGAIGVAACKIMAAAIQAVNPSKCVHDSVRLTNQKLLIGEQVIDLDQIKRVFVLGFGKASALMGKALIDILEEKVVFAKVVTKDAKFQALHGYRNKLQVLIGSHPLPSMASVDATRAVLNSLPALKTSDLVLIVISGGSSALFTSPVEGISIEDLQQATQKLLMCGADIQEINTLRKHLDEVKGGRLAKRLQPAKIHTLILSDVIGDRLDMIASGPTVPDPTTYSDALEIIKKYNLLDQLPAAIVKFLEKGFKGDYPETIKHGELLSDEVHNHLIGSNFQACQAAKRQAEQLGINSAIISSNVTGQTKNVAKLFAGIVCTEIVHSSPISTPVCLVFGGEPTVKVKGNGLGGRNQDLALHMVPELEGKSGVLFISLATDGEDGPTDAAGAAVDGSIYEDGLNILEQKIVTYMNNNDSYHYFEEVGGLIKIGATGTNVNDLILILIYNPEAVGIS